MSNCYYTQNKIIEGPYLVREVYIQHTYTFSKPKVPIFSAIRISPTCCLFPVPDARCKSVAVTWCTLAWGHGGSAQNTFYSEKEFFSLIVINAIYLY